MIIVDTIVQWLNDSFGANIDVTKHDRYVDGDYCITAVSSGKTIYIIVQSNESVCTVDSADCIDFDYLDITKPSFFDDFYNIMLKHIDVCKNSFMPL